MDIIKEVKKSDLAKAHTIFHDETKLCISINIDIALRKILIQVLADKKKEIIKEIEGMGMYRIDKKEIINFITNLK